jgi:DeoR family glycerol-3-phosphate regulon repressor
MKVQKRHQLVIEFIRKKNKVTVDELSKKFNTSHETIRRDLSQLANIGKIQKIHGGAVLPRMLEEGSFHSRTLKNVEEKINIAKCAAKLFSHGETLFIDTGSTTRYFAEEIINIGTHLKVITNSVEIAHIIAKNSKNQVFLLGGQYNCDNRQTVGAMMQRQTQYLRAHHAVLTVGALGTKFGVMDFNIEEAQIAQTFIKQSASVTIIVDASKFERLTTFRVCSLSEIDRIICDVMPPENLHNAIKEADIDLIIAD